MARIGALRRRLPREPRYGASPRAYTPPSAPRSQEPRPDTVVTEVTRGAFKGRPPRATAVVVVVGATVVVVAGVAVVVVVGLGLTVLEVVAAGGRTTLAASRGAAVAVVLSTGAVVAFTATVVLNVGARVVGGGGGVGATPRTTCTAGWGTASCPPRR